MSFEAVVENVATMTETEKFDLLTLIVDSLKKTAEPFSKNSAKKYSEHLKSFRSKYSDFLGSSDNAKEINGAFENLRDKNEPLRGSMENVW